MNTDETPLGLPLPTGPLRGKGDNEGSIAREATTVRARDKRSSHVRTRLRIDLDAVTKNMMQARSKDTKMPYKLVVMKEDAHKDPGETGRTQNGGGCSQLEQQRGGETGSNGRCG